MKKIYTLMIMLFAGTAAYSQCSVTVTGSTNVTCFGSCNGGATVTTVGLPAFTYLWMPGGQTVQNPTNLCAGTHTVTMTDANSCVATATVTITQPGDITINAGITNTTCNGVCDGAISPVVNGGTGGYTYSWAPGGQTTSSISGLCAGSYTLTVTDGNGCTEIDTFAVTEPAPLTTTVSNTAVTCNGACNGTATATPSGGTAPYAFSWMPGGSSTGLCPGTYTVTITDMNGCTVADSTTITEPAALTASVTSTDATCNGACNGSATATPAGGTAPYTYLWVPSGNTQATATQLCAGTYTCTITDANGCTTTVTVTITEPAAMQTAAAITGNATCFGTCDGVGVATATGGNPGYTFAWMPGNLAGSTQNALCGGTYTVTATDVNGCTATTTVMVTQPPALVVTLTGNDASSPGATDGSASAAASGGTGTYTYLWTPGNVTTSNITGLGAGSYVCCVTDANNCTTCDTVIILDGTGVIDIADVYGISVYPNPANEQFQVATTKAADITVTMYDLAGKMIFTDSYFSGGNTARTFTLAGQPAGVYFLEIEIGGSRMTRKLVRY